MNEWKDIRLGDITDWFSGGTPSKQNKEYWNGNIPWISARTLKSTRISDSEINITELGLKNGSRLAKKDDLLILVRGSGLFNFIPICIVEKPVAFNQDIKAIRIIEEFNWISPWFLLFWFHSNKRLLNGIMEVTGIGAGKFDTGILQNLIIKIPPLDVLNEITRTFKAFDDKIEILQAQNKTLEDTSQTIFAEWFGKYQISDKLPEGWRFAKVNEFIASTLGGDYGKEEIEDDFDQKTLCLRGTDLPDMKMGTPQKAPIRYLKKSKLDKCKLINGDLVIEISGGTENQSTGRVMYINDVILENSSLPMTCVNFCRIVRPIDISHSYFLHSLFDYLYNRKVFFNWENGTTGIKNLNLNAFLEGFELIVPNEENKILEFNELVKSSFIKIQTNNIQIQTLTKTRDELLPRLMSGEVRLNEFKG